MNGKALPGERYCAAHQGNHSHYAEHNCAVCRLASRLAEAERRVKELEAERVPVPPQARQHLRRRDDPRGGTGGRSGAPHRDREEAARGCGGEYMSEVAALFVDPSGCYSGIQGVDLWPESRDARKYTGDVPVVAHPPCQLWGSYAFVNFKRWGGDHNRPGNDRGCFTAALAAVRRCGGVLEHPAKSRAWTFHGLPKPTGIGWNKAGHDEYVCEVWQSAYGHKAAKATWLFYKGAPPSDLNWSREPGSHQIGFHDQRGKDRNKPTVSGRAASATPPDFRDALLALARNSTYPSTNHQD